MQQTGIPDEAITETPEDVAILYSWANLHGAKYRDFSASRREYRAQVRHRAAEEARAAELKAKAEAEAAAAEAERVAREAERAARSPDALEGTLDRERALREAEEAARRASAERVEAARRAEAAAIAEAAARREEREIAEAHASAERQAASWHEFDQRHRAAAGPQPLPPGVTGDPYQHPENPSAFEGDVRPLYRETDERQRLIFADEEQMYPPRTSQEPRAYRPQLEVRRRPQGYRPDMSSGVREIYRSAADRARYEAEGYAPRQGAYPFERDARPGYGQPVQLQASAAPALRNDPVADPRYAPRGGQQRFDPRFDYDPRPQAAMPAGPAWLYGGGAVQQPVPTPVLPPVAPEPAVPDTLQYSRERVAARWFALKGVFEPGQTAPVEPAPQPLRGPRLPILAVFSLAGGVGKTSLLATLGRALSSVGEKVLLVDTTSHGLLPFYFGASELRPGVVRTFSPPSGSDDAPIHLVSYDVDKAVGNTVAQERFADELLRNAAVGTQRLLLDLNINSGWVLGRLGRLNPTVLVPVAPDMNSVISLQSVEKYFHAMVDAEGRTIQPYYVLNQFDASLPLHLDVREVLRRQLGDRLLVTAIRRAPAVSEALAEGMTVVDYVPDAAIADDYRNIATWLRGLTAPATQAQRNSRWSER